MKRLSIFLLLLSSIFHSRAQDHINLQDHIKQYIAHFSPTGETQKKVDELTLELGDAQVQTNQYRVVIFTDENTLRDVLAYIISNNTRQHEAGGMFGSFGVSVFNQTAQLTSYYLTSNFASQAYLKRLIAGLTEKKADQHVIDELQKILAGISN